jgi:hypothetical protein
VLEQELVGLLDRKSKFAQQMEVIALSEAKADVNRPDEVSTDTASMQQVENY